MIYFVTICVANRKSVLANERTLEALKVSARKLDDWRVLAAVLMPDHLHIIVTPAEDRGAKVGNFSVAMKRWIRREPNAQWEWQRGSFDRLLRSGESLHSKWLYL